MEHHTDLEDAVWICAPDQAGPNPPRQEVSAIRAAYFRQSFELPAGCTLLVSVSASSRYRLWVNGRHAACGPCKGDRWTHYYERVDVSPYLRAGRNVIAARVVAYPPREAQGRTAWGPVWAVTGAAAPCLILQGVCRDGAGRPAADVTTGRAAWLAHPDEAAGWALFPESGIMGAMEVVDGSKIPRGWASAGIREEEWRPAEPLWTNRPDPFGLLPVFPLKERPIPPLYERPKAFVREMPLSPQDCAPFSFGPAAVSGHAPQPPRAVRLPPHAHMAVELDAGELTTAYFRIRMQNGKGGRLTVRYAERYFPTAEDAQAGRGEVRDDSLHGRLAGHADVYFPSGADETYEPFWWRAFRFVRIEVETGGEGITLYPPACTETGYPLRVESHIRSSAGWVNELWDISLRTLRRCTHETYEDCPYYEQLQYTMDARLESLFTHALGGDVRLSRRAIRDFHASLLPEGILQSRYPSNEPQVIPAFALHWIFMLQDDYWETGEPAFIRRYRPTVDAVLDWFDRRTGPLGLVENLGYWDFADWADEWSASNGTPSAALTGPSTIHNLSYACALQSAAELNRATGREGVAQEYEARAASILQAVNRCCWSEQRGLYREGPDCGQYSQHAQVWAVLSGAAEGARAKYILQGALRGQGLVKCSFPLQFYLFRALEKAGMYEMTFPLWELWKSLLPLHLTTVPETPAHSRSDCHGWGALPLYEFTRNILGVQPAAPGWIAIEIRPMCRMLADAKGEVSTPRGPIGVEWETADGQVGLTVRLPGQVCAVLRLPGGEERELRPGSSRMTVSA